MNYTIDVGNHLFALGALYILLKPILYLLAVGLVVYFGYRLFKKIDTSDPFTPHDSVSEMHWNPKFLIGIAIGIILFVVLVLG